MGYPAQNRSFLASVSDLTAKPMDQNMTSKSALEYEDASNFSLESSHPIRPFGRGVVVGVPVLVPLEFPEFFEAYVSD